MLATKCVGSPRALPRGNAVTAVTLLTKAKCLRLLPWSARLHEAVLRNISCRRWQRKPYLSLPVHGQHCGAPMGTGDAEAVAGVSLLPSFLPYDVVTKHSGKLQYFLVSYTFPL